MFRFVAMASRAIAYSACGAMLALGVQKLLRGKNPQAEWDERVQLARDWICDIGSKSTILQGLARVSAGYSCNGPGKILAIENQCHVTSTGVKTCTFMECMYENRVALFGFERKGCPFSIDGSPMLMRWFHMRDPFVDLRLQVQQERVETQPIDGKAIAAEAGRFSGFIRMDQLSKSASQLLVI